LPVSVTVIICTYNRAHLLKRTLKSLARQTVATHHFEIIVVDDGSTDDTVLVCNSMREDLPNLKYISSAKNSGLAHARNLGMNSAKGKHILFTDDDCIVSNNWVERMNYYLAREHIVAGSIASSFSNYLTISENIGIFHAFMSDREAGCIEFIPGANMGFRLSILKDLRGFNPNSMRSDDMEIILRARLKGYSAIFAPDSVVTHCSQRKKIWSILRHSLNQGRSAILLRIRYSKLLKTPFILTSPILIILTTPLIALIVTGEIYLKNSFARRHLFTFPVVYLMKFFWCMGASIGLLFFQSRRSSKV
jgi:glycosyltransferase involved in cell wall biosynthesis